MGEWKRCLRQMNQWEKERLQVLWRRRHKLELEQALELALLRCLAAGLETGSRLLLMMGKTLRPHSYYGNVM